MVDLVARPPGVPAVEETGETLEDNARLKAVALVAATGEPPSPTTPAWRSRHSAGPPGTHGRRVLPARLPVMSDNVAKLLVELEGEDRSAGPLSHGGRLSSS